MKISGELQFKPNECKCEYDNCFDCLHFICWDDDNTIECNYEDNEQEIGEVKNDDVL